VFSQNQFKWEKIDTIGKTKEQLYTDTKIFIANTWKSSQDVLQNDDKDSGIIILRGSSSQKINYLLTTFHYIYSYTVTFKMKDNKYKISIDNVFCDKAYLIGKIDNNICKIEPFDGEYIKCKRGFMGNATLPENKALELMEKLKSEINYIFYGYELYINSPVKTDDW
jgi:hypothetical protein